MENPKELFDSAIAVKHSSLNRGIANVPIKKDSTEDSKLKQ